MSFTVFIQDESLPAWPSESSAYHPQVYRFHDAHPNPSIHLVDVVEVWQGLSCQQAHELTFWHNALREAIERYVHDTLVSNFNQAQVRPDAREMHAFILRLGDQQVLCDVNYLIENMTQQQRSNRPCCRWLEMDRRTALTNLIRLHHCFFEDQPVLHLYLYSEITHDGGLHVFARVHTKPHIFELDQLSRRFRFQSPLLDDSKAFYPVEVSELKCDESSNHMLLVASTLFPFNVRFKRTFRFRNGVVIPPPPTSRSAEKPVFDSKTFDSKKKRKGRKLLREISQTSVRVQGMSDFEKAAQENHPQLYRAHHDHTIGKSSVLGKLYGNKTLSPQRPTTNMMYNHQDRTVRRPETVPHRRAPFFYDSDSSVPLPPSAQMHCYDEDHDDDTLFSFSPARLVPEVLSRLQPTPSQRLEDLFASPFKSHARDNSAQEKGKTPLRGSHISDSPYKSGNSSVFGSPMRSPTRKGKGSKRQSYEQVFMRGESSQSTVEISPPGSEDY